MFPLRNFELHIDEKVLQRGREYYEDGAVSECIRCGDSAYRGGVDGTWHYTVSVRLSADTVSDLSCSCPFTMGPVCKHEVAMLYVIRDGHVAVQKGTPSSALDIEKRLSKVSKEELVEFISREQKENPALQRRIALAYGSAEYFEDKKFIKKIIGDALDEAKDRDGFIGYWESADAVSGALEVLSLAEQLATSSPRATLRICQSVIDVMAPVLIRCDDSNGDVSGVLVASLEMLRSLSRRPLGDELHSEFMAYLLAEHSKKVHEGWDVSWELLSIAGELSVQSELDTLFSVIDEYVAAQDERQKGNESVFTANSFIQQYNQERAAEVKLFVIQKNRNAREVELFFEKNMSIPAIREKAVEFFLQRNELRRARTLAHEGVVQAKREGHHGTAFSFYKKLLDIAQADKNASEIIRYAKILFLESHEHEERYYELLKNYTSRTEWSKVWKEIAHALGNDDPYALASILKKEKKWNELMILVEHHPHLANDYDSSLSAQFPKRLALVYKIIVEEHMEYPGGRREYQDKCAILKRIQRLGEEQLVTNIVREWRATFEKRRALMEELHRAGF